MSKANTYQMLMRDTILPQKMEEYATIVDKSSFFEFYCSQQYLKTFELSDEEIEEGIGGGGQGGGCDAIYLFLNGNLVQPDSSPDLSRMRTFNLELYIFQMKQSLGFEEAAILKLKTFTENLLDITVDVDQYEGRYSDALREKVNVFKGLYKKSLTKNTTLHIHYVYASLGTEVSSYLNAQGEELRIKCANLFPVSDVDVSFVDAERLFLLSRQNPDPYRNLRLGAQPIGNSNGDGYVALVRLGDYYSFLCDGDRMQSGLLDANVRDYQGLNNVNKAILDTLANNHEDEFWWLNNGVTILARGISLVSQVEFRLEDPKIVNGLQTSREIFDYFKANPANIANDKRSVLVRVISTDEESSRDKIILATNSQTTIPPASLRATDPIHFQIELYCKKKGLYYDRRKNQYRNQGIKLCDIISIGFLGQCLISLLMLRPDSARARPSTILSDDLAYSHLFNKENSLEMYYRVARAGRKISEFLWKCDILTRSQRTNIFYYVIYAVCARIIGKDKLLASDLEKLDLARITQSYVDEVIRLVFDLFQSNGGSDQLAKGNEFKDRLVHALIVKGWITPLDQRKVQKE